MNSSQKGGARGKISSSTGMHLLHFPQVQTHAHSNFKLKVPTAPLPSNLELTLPLNRQIFLCRQKPGDDGTSDNNRLSGVEIRF